MIPKGIDVPSVMMSLLEMPPPVGVDADGFGLLIGVRTQIELSSCGSRG